MQLLFASNQKLDLHEIFVCEHVHFYHLTEYKKLKISFKYL